MIQNRLQKHLTEHKNTKQKPKQNFKVIQITDNRAQNTELSSKWLLASWNYYGLGNPITIQRLKEIRKVNASDIIFLPETKNPDEIVLK